MSKWRARRDGDPNPRRWKIYARFGPAGAAEAFAAATRLPAGGRVVEVQFAGPPNAAPAPWLPYRVTADANGYALATRIDPPGETPRAAR